MSKIPNVEEGYGFNGVFFKTEEEALRAQNACAVWRGAVELAEDLNSYMDTPPDLKTIQGLLRAHEEDLDEAVVGAIARNKARNSPDVGVDRGFEGCPPGCC